MMNDSKFNYDKLYDDSNPEAIEKYAQGMIGKSFREIFSTDNYSKVTVIRESSQSETSYGNERRKGGLGELVEEHYFHYPANNDSRPDFPDAGVELKVTPFKINKDGKTVAKERLIISMIDYFSVVNEDFWNSHVWAKSNLILLIYYLYIEEIKDRLDYRVEYAKLFSPPDSDLKIIEEDFYKIVGKIKAGKAHELSEGDTMYLGAASKAATSADRRKQPYSDILAKPRAFSFKNSYMTYVLNNYIIPGKTTYEPIISTPIQETFEEYVTRLVDSYSGKSVDELCKIFGVNLQSKPKNLGALLAYRILGIKGNHAEEFVKANIVVKTIRIEKNNRIKESMSFPTFKFTELIKEEWDDCTFGNMLRETRFLFVVYKYDQKGNLILKGCKFWNIPYADLENDVRSVWERTKQVIIDGVRFERTKSGVSNNFPKASENRVCHVRPHGKDSSDTYELPDGRKCTKQCFWLNNNYILEQMDSKFF